MTVDHPTREERYAAVLAEHAGCESRRVSIVNGVSNYERFCMCGHQLPWRAEPLSSAHRAHVAAALVAADPAPAQPDAALSDEERELLGDWWDSDWPADAPHVLVTLYATVERILAARAAQPVPVPTDEPAAWLCVHGFGIHEAGRAHHDDDTPLFTQPVPAPEVSRGVAEVKAEALREAADDLCLDEHGWAGDYGTIRWLRDRADRLVRDALGGERGEG